MTPAHLLLGALLLGGGCARDAVLSPEGAITIAIVDDGVDLSHPDLRQRISVNGGEVPDNAVDDDHNGLVDDVNGYDFLDRDSRPNPAPASGDPSHGTMMALISLNAARAAGLSPDQESAATSIRVLPLRVANESIVDPDAATAAISYARRRGGRVIVNLSLGTIRSSLPEALTAAISANREILFVVAAGNQGKRISEMRASLCRIPARNLVCVAAVDRNDRLAAFPKASNFGPQVEVAAPGVDISVIGSKGAVRKETGTSLAAAAASGIAARVWSAAPALSAAGLAEALCAGARRSDVLGDAVQCGIIDGARSLRWLRGHPRTAAPLHL